MAGGQPLGVAVVEPQRVRLHADLGIQCVHALRRQRGFFAPAVGQRIPGLTMQVRWLEPIGVDDAEPAHARAGQVLQHRHAKPAGAHHQHRGAAQPGLAFRAHFTQRDLARVVRRRDRARFMVVFVIVTIVHVRDGDGVFPVMRWVEPRTARSSPSPNRHSRSALSSRSARDV